MTNETKHELVTWLADKFRAAGLLPCDKAKDDVALERAKALFTDEEFERMLTAKNNAFDV
jgi:hypothetical protein